MTTILKKFLLAALLLTGIAFLPGARAQLVQTNASYGDLMLGFETTGGSGSTNLVIDLGTGSATNASVLLASIGSGLNLNSDLIAAFGTNYASMVSYGLYSVTSSKEIFASGLTTQTQGYALESSSGAGIQKTDFANFFGLFNNNGVLPGDITTHGVLMTTSTQYSWTYYTPNNAAFQNANYTNIEVPVGSTASLFAQPTGSSGYGTFDNLNFTVSTLGVLSVAAVPEPGTYALFVLGALVLFFALRRRARSARA
jgi:hypothetical protein